MAFWTSYKILILNNSNLDNLNLERKKCFNRFIIPSYSIFNLLEDLIGELIVREKSRS